MSKSHHFSSDIATVLGIPEAIIFNNLGYWLAKNKSNNTNKRDGMTWTYNSIKSFCELFPYLSEKSIRNAITKLCEHNLVVKGKYGDKANTCYYSFTELGYNLHEKSDLYIDELIKINKEYVSNLSQKRASKKEQKVEENNVGLVKRASPVWYNGQTSLVKRANSIYNNVTDINSRLKTLTYIKRKQRKKTYEITEYNNGLAIACEPNGFVASNNEETVQISDYKDCYDEVLSVMDKVTDIEIDNSKKDNRYNTEMELPNEQNNYSISPQQHNKQKVKQKKTTEQTKFTIEKYPHDDYYKKIALLINENRGRFSPIKFITEKFICGVDNMLELVSEQDYETALINMFDKDSYVQYPNYSSDLYTYIFDKDKIIQFLEIDFKAERERKEKKLMFDKYVSLFKETFQYSYSTKDNYHNATQLFFALSREQMECAILNIPEVLKRESVEPKIDEYLYKELYVIPETVVKEEIIEEEIILVDENELDI